METKEFEEWLYDNSDTNNVISRVSGLDLIDDGFLIAFNKLPMMARWGIYLEFFDTFNVDLDMCFCIIRFNHSRLDGSEISRLDVQKLAVEMAFQELEAKNKPKPKK